MTPLHYAVRYGHVEVVKLLVEYGAGKPDFNLFYFLVFFFIALAITIKLTPQLLNSQ